MRNLAEVYTLSVYLIFRYVIKERYQEFTNSQRSQIVWQILTRARYDNNAKEKV